MSLHIPIAFYASRTYVRTQESFIKYCFVADLYRKPLEKKRDIAANLMGEACVCVGKLMLKIVSPSPPLKTHQ